MADDKRDPLKPNIEYFHGPPQASEFDGLPQDELAKMKEWVARYDGAMTHINGLKGNGMGAAPRVWRDEGERILREGGVPQETLERIGRFRTWLETGNVPTERSPVLPEDTATIDARRDALFTPGTDFKTQFAKVHAEQKAAQQHADFANRQFMWNSTLAAPPRAEAASAGKPIAPPIDIPDGGDEQQAVGRKLLKALLKNAKKK